MPLVGIVTVVLRIYSVLWLVDGIIKCVVELQTSRYSSHGPLPFLSPFLFEGVLLILLAVIIFFLSQPIARKVVPPPNPEIEIGALTRYDLYCFAFVFLGVYFWLSSVGNTVNAFHNYLIVSSHAAPESSQRIDAFYRLTRPFLTLLAGTASVFLSSRLARKLSALDQPRFRPHRPTSRTPPRPFHHRMPNSHSPLTAGEFEQLLPLAAAWAEEQEAHILTHGIALTPAQLIDARQIGVIEPEKVRLLFVTTVPTPDHPLLRAAGEATGLISPHTAGLTLRYGIYIRRDCFGDRLLVAHELVHTGQYERFGSIENFLRQYLTECLTIGYPAAPLEQEAVTVSEKLPA